MHTLHIRHTGVKPDGTIGKADSGRKVSEPNGWIVAGNDAETGWFISLAAPREKRGNMHVNVAHFDSKKELEAWLRNAVKEVTGREVQFIRK